MNENSAKIDKVFEFADLSKYTFSQRFTIRAADLAFTLLITLIGSTLRFEVRGAEREQRIKVDKGQIVYAFWHNRIFLATYFWQKQNIVVMTSQSFDGEYIARFIQRFGYGAARGSSTRGGVAALVEMIRVMRQGFSAAFTVDGPKGPRYKVKDGVLILAKKSHYPLLPICATAEKFWEIGSWDKLQIPKPFSRALIEIGEPLEIETDADAAQMTAHRNHLQRMLELLSASGEAWRQTCRREEYEDKNF